jgi:hypothetical protein
MTKLTLCAALLAALLAAPVLGQLTPVGPVQVLSDRADDCQMMAMRDSGRYAVAWPEDDGTGRIIVRASAVDERDVKGPAQEVADGVAPYLLALRTTTTGFSLEWLGGNNQLVVDDLDLQAAPAGAPRVFPAWPTSLSGRPNGGFVATRRAHRRLEVQVLDREGAPAGRTVAIRDPWAVPWSVEHRPGGAFVVLYLSVQLRTSVWAVWFDADGRLAGKPFRVAPPGTIYFAPALGPDGTLAVLHDQPTSPGRRYSLRTFDGRGRLRGGPTPAFLGTIAFDLAVDARGRVLAVWRPDSDDPDQPTRIMARAFSARAEPIGPEVAVGDGLPTATYEYCPAVAAAADRWVVSWQTSDDGSQSQLLARRFASP